MGEFSGDALIPPILKDRTGAETEMAKLITAGQGHVSLPFTAGENLMKGWSQTAKCF